MVTYDRYDIVFQEIPNEVSLAFTIEGCPNNCIGCHSPHLREQNGKELTIQEVIQTIKQYENLITCVLFMGGDANHEELEILFDEVKKLGYKVGLYSGNEILKEKFFRYLTYYKVGNYRYEIGGLESHSTNQRMYKYQEGVLSDITNLFTKEK